MNTENITHSQLTELIERYFDCSLSDADEQRLRLIAASSSLSFPALDELRAVMGIRRPAVRRQRLSWRVAGSVAASLALVVTLAFYARSFVPNTGNTVCVAYVNGRCITDEETVVQLISADMRQFSACLDIADSAVSDDIADVIPLIELYESDPTINL